jgi:long-chain acyl-CoA synthetase
VCAGLVAELLDDGNFQIIDRKKDLVKLVHGEYIALGRIEGALIQSKFIEMVCVYGDGKHDRPIALVVPNLATLGKALASEGVPDSYLQDLKQLATHPKAAQVILKSFEECATKAKLEKWERVAALKLCDFVWTPESGLLTEAFKLKRHEITKRFKADIETTYAAVKTV